MTVLTMDGWKMQWRRVQRSFAKLNMVYSDTEVYDDDMYHFFQDAWHLKDWIKNDPALSTKIRDGIEPLANGSKYFQIAADVANGTKHMVLKWPRAWKAEVTERNVSVALGSGVATGLQERVLTLVDGSKIAAETVAKNVLHEWQSLLRQLDLV